jgi:hypothetical protein
MLIGICLIASCTQPQGFDREITQKELYAHVDLLSSDSLQGRLPGTPFDRVAAKYIKDQMELSGIKLIGRNGYQFFDFVAKQELGADNTVRISGQSLQLGTDYSIFPFSSSDSVSASVVFVGYGFSINTKALMWDDYLSVNVNGKWALILRGDPDSKNSESPFITYSSDRNKAMLANDNGAIGVIMVSGSSYDPSDELVNMSEKAFDVGIPVIQVSRNVVDRILHTSGLNVSSLEKKFLNIRRPSSFAVKANVAARTDIILQKKQTQNVVGLIEGTDPLLKNQYIVIGAHYDHLGNGGKGSSSRIPDTLGVHNGADDNASGVSAILEVAQKFAGNLNKRSIVVVAFGAEEMGLLGSRFFIENPIIPIDSIVAMINVDMVGRMSADKALQVGGVKTSLESEGLIDKVNEVFKFNMAKSPEGYGPSDHASFYGKDIPVFFISTGAHVDYHTPNDKIDRINFEGLFETSQFIEAIVTELVSVSQKLTFQEAGPKSSPTRHGRDLKVKLGIMPDVSGATNDGLKVLAVTPNNPAFIAGIKKDDIITALNGQKVNNIHDYMFRLKDLKPGNTISVELKRNGEKLVVLVQL